jgi:type I restriction enzyme R subunit
MNKATEQGRPQFLENLESQIPAVQLLQLMGWEYVTSAETIALRGKRRSGVVLDGILEAQLRAHNRIRYRGEEIPFSEGNIVTAIQALKDVIYDGLIRTNEKIYDLLCLGKSLPQSIQGDIKSFTLQYIDWERPERNTYHVTEEFEVERTGSKEAYIPDVVLFVNGIPLVVIECKRSELLPGQLPIPQAISQHIRNQKEDGIPQLFIYSQLLLAVSRKEARYGTTGTPEKFWAAWNEPAADDEVSKLLRTPLTEGRRARLFEGGSAQLRDYFEALESAGSPREVTAQDRTLWALCRPERLLDLIYRFIVFDAGEKKITRYQQYFAVLSILNRIRLIRDGRRTGGVVWHTQGSGKSLTMVMLAKAIALEQQRSAEADWNDYKIVLVTDRVDLDDQITRTFMHCGIEPEQASTGKDLVEMLSGSKQRVITTVINKFEAAVGKAGVRCESPNIFVLVDEGHRTQFGSMHAKMRRALPNACFIAFTGTPVMKRDKSTIEKFGGLIAPSYTIRNAVDDEAVVPLLYEGRHAQQRVDQAAIDEWFERTTQKLTPDQRAELKKKFAKTERLFRAEPVVKSIAWDVSEHFAKNWKGTGCKGQLVAPRKETAIRYKQFLDQFGKVRSEVLISPPDDREGEEDIYGENKEVVNRFWKSAMERYGTAKQYEQTALNSFKYGDPRDEQQGTPEIIIVVDKLLTGFDCPANTVLYLARSLKEHSLLQAIARVNRLFPGKDFGYIIDYRGVLPHLDEALSLYSELPEFDEEDLADTVTDIRAAVDKVPQKHSALWDVFKTVRNKNDVEAFELLLADEALRVDFYDRFAAFARGLSIAMSSEIFFETTPTEKIDRYKKNLKFFKELRQSVRRRYAETVDFSEYEPKIKKLLDTYLQAEQVEPITGAIDLFNRDARSKAIEEAHGEAAKADTIAHNTKRVLTERWEKEDPAFFKKFSRMLQDVIDDFRAERLQSVHYLKRATEIMEAVLTRIGDDTPEILTANEVAKAYYGSIKASLGKLPLEAKAIVELSTEAALEFDQIVDRRRIVNWTTNVDVQNRVRQDFEDYLFDLRVRSGVEFDFNFIDQLGDECLAVAKVRRP